MTRSVKIAGICLLASILVLLSVMYIVPATEKSESEKVNNSGDWMSEISGDIYLSEMNIPGSHDCGTNYVQLPFFSKCQNDDVKTQLENGYRYLDIRLGIEKKQDEVNLVLMHGFTHCRKGFWPWSGKLTLEDVLDDCANFLDQHPDETIIFVVKKEHGDEDVAEFQQWLQLEEEKYPDLFFFSERMPRLDEARGKVVLFRRYEDEAGLGRKAGLPLIWEEQPGADFPDRYYETHDNGKYHVCVQDKFELGTRDKWKVFTGAKKRFAEPSSSEVRINFLSTKGSLPYGHPYSFAKKLNKKLLTEANTMPSGWTIVDFGTAEIAEKIYNSPTSSIEELFAGVSKHFHGYKNVSNEVYDLDVIWQEGASKEDKIYSFLQGPVSWETKADWSGEWCKFLYNNRSFGKFGCGMCCMANVYDTLSNKEGSPIDAFDFAISIGYEPTEKSGAIGWGALKIAFRKMGMDCDVWYKPDSYEEFRKQMANCESMVVLVCSDADDTFWKHTSGHYVNIWDYNEENDDVFLAEPGDPNNNRTRIPLKYVYDALKITSKYQYIRIDGYNPAKDEWQPNGIEEKWIKPVYYVAK